MILDSKVSIVTSHGGDRPIKRLFCEIETFFCKGHPLCAEKKIPFWRRFLRPLPSTVPGGVTAGREESADGMQQRTHANSVVASVNDAQGAAGKRNTVGRGPAHRENEPQ